MLRPVLAVFMVFLPRRTTGARFYPSPYVCACLLVCKIGLLLYQALKIQPVNTYSP